MSARKPRQTTPTTPNVAATPIPKKPIHIFWAWLRKSKPTEWITAIATAAGILVIYKTGIFDARNSELSAKSERLQLGNDKLETRSRELTGEIDSKNRLIAELNQRLTPLESEREGIRKVIGLRREIPDQAGGLKYEIRADLELNLEFDGLILKAFVLASPIPRDSLNVPSGRSTSAFSHSKLSDLLEAAAKIERLQELWLGSFRLTQDHVEILNKCKNLKILVIDRGGLSDETAARLVLPKSIVSLRLPRNSLTRIPNCPGIQELKVLYLSENPIKDNGIASIAASVPELVGLGLDGTEITDDGLGSLIGLDRLGFLSIQRTRVVGAGIIKLLDLRSLYSLTIEDNRITDQLRTVISAKKPGLQLGISTAPPTPYEPPDDSWSF